jgi:hypothetical protein
MTTGRSEVRHVPQTNQLAAMRAFYCTRLDSHAARKNDAIIRMHLERAEEYR